jgi:hypothetical protein
MPELNGGELNAERDLGRCDGFSVPGSFKTSRPGVEATGNDEAGIS